MMFQIIAAIAQWERSRVLSEKRTANSKVLRLVTQPHNAERTAQSDQVAVIA
jgi:hypothetical protein